MIDPTNANDFHQKGNETENGPLPLPPAPLQYESGRDRAGRNSQLSRFTEMVIFGVGFVIGGGLVLFGSAYVFMLLPGQNRTPHRIAGGIYIAAFLLTIFAAVRFARRTPWLAGQILLLGFLIGAGLALLLNGVCFSAL